LTLAQLPVRGEFKRKGVSDSKKKFICAAPLGSDDS
jgi:hypothetical protein